MKTQLLIWGVPVEVKADFKATCARKNETMKDIIIQFMKDYAWENQCSTSDDSQSSTP